MSQILDSEEPTMTRRGISGYPTTWTATPNPLITKYNSILPGMSGND